MENVREAKKVKEKEISAISTMTSDNKQSGIFIFINAMAVPMRWLLCVSAALLSTTAYASFDTASEDVNAEYEENTTANDEFGEYEVLFNSDKEQRGIIHIFVNNNDQFGDSVAYPSDFNPNSGYTFRNGSDFYVSFEDDSSDVRGIQIIYGLSPEEDGWSMTRNQVTVDQLREGLENLRYEVVERESALVEVNYQLGSGFLSNEQRGELISIQNQLKDELASRKNLVYRISEMVNS